MPPLKTELRRLRVRMRRHARRCARLAQRKSREADALGDPIISHQATWLDGQARALDVCARTLNHLIRE